MKGLPLILFKFIVEEIDNNKIVSVSILGKFDKKILLRNVVHSMDKLY